MFTAPAFRRSPGDGVLMKIPAPRAILSLLQGGLPMPSALAEKSCTPCRGGVPPLTPEEAARYQAQAPYWELLDDARRIERTYRFKNFAEAFAFVGRAAALAETEAHHPDINFGWGYATISLRTTPRRSKGCMRTTSSWRQSSTGPRPKAQHRHSGNHSHGGNGAHLHPAR
jgi:4a-hydroxytetrahydrobiopterin dehydratase